MLWWMDFFYADIPRACLIKKSTPKDFQVLIYRMYSGINNTIWHPPFQTKHFQNEDIQIVLQPTSSL